MESGSTTKEQKNQKTMKGFLYKQSDHIKQWRKRYAIIDNTNFKIYQDDKLSLNDLKEASLSDYTIKWNDNKKDFYNFTLTATNKSAKYKTFVLGDKSEQVVNEWYNFLNQIINSSKIAVQTPSTIANSPNSQFDSSSSPIKSPQDENSGLNTEIKNYSYGDIALPKDTPKWVLNVIDQNKLSNDQHITFDTKDNNDWGIIKNEKNIKVFQAASNGLIFKTVVLVKSSNASKVYKILLNVEERQKWDESLDKATFVNLINSYRYCAIKQANKAYGMLYLPREFLYLQYTFRRANSYFIFAKSYEDNNIQKSVRIPRGMIEYSIIRVTEGQEGAIISQIIHYTNGGMCSLSQDTSISLYALSNLANIENYAKKISEEALSKFNGLEELENSSNQAPDFSDKTALNFTENKDIGDDDQQLENNSQESDDNDDFEEEKKVDVEGNEKTYETPTITVNYEIKEGKPSDSQALLAALEKVFSNQYIKECIDPSIPAITLSESELMAIQDDKDGHFFYKQSWKHDPNGGLELIDQQLLERQKHVIGHVLKSLGKNLLAGKSVMNISLPIIIFSRDTILQRAASSFVYAPHFLEKAGASEDYLEKIKNSIVFFFTSLHTAIDQEKPFNPILGETYQGIIGGIPVFLEQTSHHPPISSFYMRGKKFFLHGSYHVEAKLGPNSADALQKGRACISYEDAGMNVYAHFPIAVITGTMFGKRSFNWTKKFKIYESKHNIYCELICNPDEKGFVTGLFSRKKVVADRVYGKIWECTPEFISKLVKKQNVKFDPKVHVVKELSTIEGIWTEYLDFDGVRYWSIEEYRPYKLIHVPNKALPSDSTYRTDLICRRFGDYIKGQSEKERLENIQRADRKLREKLGKGTKHQFQYQYIHKQFIHNCILQ